MTSRISLALLFLIGCSGKRNEIISDYTLSKPDRVFELPGKLREISGIAYVNDSTMACVQDEHGGVFLYNLRVGKIFKEIPIGANGDYEDLAVIGRHLYVLKSDGLVVEVLDFYTEPKVREISSGLKRGFDFEGLSAADGGILLMASKSKKSIHRLNVVDETFSEERIKIETAFGFAPSALAIHPTSGEIYVLGSVGNRLLIMSPEGIINQTARLDHPLFKQPEGITFSPTGDLFISNEGRDGKANILKFRKR
jgi:uncharacterized protein YjiK